MSEMTLFTTLNELKKHNPCAGGYKKLLKHIGADYPADKPIDLRTILKSNGFDDTIWVLRAAMPVADRDRIARLFACDCAESVLHIYEEEYPDDNRPRNAIEVARRYALGQATEEELQAARNAADASWSAAWDAARYAARDAARYAADAAGAAAAAMSAASYAAAAASYAADAAWDAEAKKQYDMLEAYLGGDK